MAYNTPELLLVGAAQNLVLGFPIAKLSPSSDQLIDDDTTGYWPNTADSASW